MNNTPVEETKTPEVSPKKMIRQKKGVVVSDKMDKTVVVAVDRYRIHPLYRKRYKITRRLKAHDPQNQYKTGDLVIIQETRPLSRQKRWIVTGKSKSKQ